MSIFYDVIIIGAGPSGLIASYELSKNSDLSICVLEKGKHFNERSRGSFDIVYGIGGAGLFSDGKLCLSNMVGERLNNVTDVFTMETVQYIDNILKNKGVIKKKSDKDFKKIVNKANNFNLNIEYYDVRRLFFEQFKSYFSELEKEMLKRNVKILVNHNVIDINQNVDGTWSIKSIKDKKLKIFNSKYLLVGTGKSGAKWFLEQVKKLNIKTEPTPFYLGIKIETKREIMEPLTHWSYNPKISFGQKGVNYIKTHCFCEGGIVISYNFNNNIKLVGGISGNGENTNFSILLEQHVPNNYSTLRYCNWVCNLINQIGGQKIILQKLGDFKKSKSSKKSEIKINEIQPTLTNFSLKNISKIFPFDNILTMIKFIKKINNICPGLDDDSTLIYTPVSEWCVDKVQVGENMETKRKNLYAIGDGAGNTQGIIAAAATGLIAARDIILKTR